MNQKSVSTNFKIQNVDKIFHSLNEESNYIYIPSNDIELGRINGLYIELHSPDFKMESNLFCRFNNLTKMVLSTNRIEYHSDIFRGLDNLKILSINHFELKNLVDKGPFFYLVNLKHLYLAISPVQSLDSRFFQGLNQLITLKMKHFHIKWIQNNTFRHLTNLESFCLGVVGYHHTINQDTFQHLENLKELKLDFSIYSLSKIDDYSFSQLKRLELFKIGFAETNGIYNKTFYGLQNLKKVDVAHVAHIIFPDSKYLQTTYHGVKLNKTYSKIQKINDMLFERIINELKKKNDSSCLTNLEVVNFSHNEIRTIDKKSFKILEGLPNFRKLILASSKIESLDEEAFKPFQNNIQFIDLSGNPLNKQELFKAIQTLTNLVELNISCCQIRSIPTNSFDNLKNLKCLNLSGNHIRKITKESYNLLENLTSLNLEKCKIVEIEEKAFENISNLESLNLHNNKITSINAGMFSGLTNLKTLNLRCNMITRLDKDAFKPFESSINILILSENKVFNNIQQLFESFKSMNNLTHLKIDDCGIKSIPENAFDNLINLQELDISRNNIEYFDEKLFSNLKKIKKIHNYCAYRSLRYINLILSTDYQ